MSRTPYRAPRAGAVRLPATPTARPFSGGIACLHFLKIDIEGHELSALKGAEPMIREGRIDFIQFEFGGANVDSRTYFRDFFTLLKPNFRIYRIVRDGLRPIEQYMESYEQFNTINYLVGEALKSSATRSAS